MPADLEKCFFQRVNTQPSLCIEIPVIFDPVRPKIAISNLKSEAWSAIV